MRSNFEVKLARELDEQGIQYGYETLEIKYVKPAVPAKEATYTPDFILPNGVIVEAKGKFVTSDRKKHILIKEQAPHFDIRFVFYTPGARCFADKGYPQETTCASWCEKNGFMYAFRSIPEEWLHE